MVCLLLTVGAVPVAAGAQETERLVFPSSGFSISAFDSGPSGDVPHTPLMMLHSPVGGFSANVNVQIQPFAGTMNEYLETTKREFLTYSFEMLHGAVTDAGTIELEYTGDFQGKAMHWLARAEARAGLMYLVTATVPAERWDELEGEARRCVDSFRLENLEGGGDE